MSWFRRRDTTLNEQLLRAAGYVSAVVPPAVTAEQAGAVSTEPQNPSLSMPEPASPTAPDWDDEPDPSRGALGRLIGPPARGPVLSGEWTAFASTEAPDLTGWQYEFVTLPDGTLVVDDSCEEDLSRLADAVEGQLKPPYRAVGTRQASGVWTVAARPVHLERLAADGDELELSSFRGTQSLTVDAGPRNPADAPPTLAALGERCGGDYVVRATRVDEDMFETTADPL